VRIVCNTWGLPGRTPAAIKDVGAYNNVRLLLYTHSGEGQEDDGTRGALAATTAAAETRAGTKG
jgi:hypothetical protein